MSRQKSAVRETPARRCAIYTRKSTSVGLDQEFNTLDAQREVCERYIQSQVSNGWQILPAQYDDGGFTGANLERPGFRKLMADAERGRIDIVVVYKVDRLSRSLLDFATVMDRFGSLNVDFVSVTQNFSTADAMGRLTLNMLMSFSEYEREMITERTRDKIASARRRGKWTGGRVPLGYDVVDKKLVVNRADAKTARTLFELYVENRSVMTTALELNRRGMLRRGRPDGNGKVRRIEWNKPSLLSTLRNPVLAGYMPHGENLYEGEHQGIIDRDLFHRAKLLLERWTDRRPGPGFNPDYFLRGLLRCGCGGAMTPASTKQVGRVYRYYRCSVRDKYGNQRCAARQLPAHAIEDFVLGRIRDAVASGVLPDALAARLSRVRKTKEQAIADRAALDDPACASDDEDLRYARCHADIQIAEVEHSEADLDWAGQVLQDFDAAWALLTAVASPGPW